ncbi:hypothetical protein PUN28_016117 [Cardiocondyla obscurior]|uniref:Uncharacterized protein n=1 Tax=Cardiocondyla obscurior TaxID=286306 RepID=A0AAW2ESR4_9HYME
MCAIYISTFNLPIDLILDHRTAPSCLTPEGPRGPRESGNTAKGRARVGRRGASLAEGRGERREVGRTAAKTTTAETMAGKEEPRGRRERGRDAEECYNSLQIGEADVQSLT